MIVKLQKTASIGNRFSIQHWWQRLHVAEL